MEKYAFAWLAYIFKAPAFFQLCIEHTFLLATLKGLHFHHSNVLCIIITTRCGFRCRISAYVPSLKTKIYSWIRCQLYAHEVWKPIASIIFSSWLFSKLLFSEIYDCWIRLGTNPSLECEDQNLHFCFKAFYFLITKDVYIIVDLDSHDHESHMFSVL